MSLDVKLNHFIFIWILFFRFLNGEFNLTIVHNNDVHAHFDQTNVYAGECTDILAKSNSCYGGEARRNAFIKDARRRYQHTLVLDAGDRFIGTLWFTLYKGEAAATFVNMENYDAVCLGNHEFDRGVAGLVPYLENLTVPVLDANIDISQQPMLRGLFNASMIKEVDGVKIGIIGYITTDTAFISNAGTKPSVENIEGPYPTVITQDSGRQVLVVQAYAWGKYMGFLNVTFDDQYEVAAWSGQPILLDNSIQPDPDTQRVLDEMKKPLERMKQQIVGRTVVRMEGDPIQCRLKECNSGNLLTDSWIEYHIDKKESNDTWALAAIALLSGGGIRASTEAGDISMGQVLQIFPFGSVIDMIQIKGVHLKEAFEHSVSKYDIHDRPGAFFQMSGAHVVYDLSQAPGQRVVSLDLRCLHCTVPRYEPIDLDAVYNILVRDFTIKGGDGFTMITDNVIRHVQTNSLDTDVLRAYLQNHNPVFPEVEGRIKFVDPTNGCRHSGVPNIVG